MDKFLVPNQSSQLFEQLSDEFLNALLQEEMLYPWNPLDIEAEAFLAQKERDIALADCLSSEEIDTQVKTFYQSVDSQFEPLE